MAKNSVVPKRPDVNRFLSIKTLKELQRWRSQANQLATALRASCWCGSMNLVHGEVCLGCRALIRFQEFKHREKNRIKQASKKFTPQIGDVVYAEYIEDGNILRHIKGVYQGDTSGGLASVEFVGTHINITVLKSTLVKAK